MPYTPKEIIKLLEANGYEYVKSNGSHRKYCNNKTNSTIIVPYHNNTLKTGTEKAILKQANLKGRK